MTDTVKDNAYLEVKVRVYLDPSDVEWDADIRQALIGGWHKERIIVRLQDVLLNKARRRNMDIFTETPEFKGIEQFADTLIRSVKL